MNADEWSRACDDNEQAEYLRAWKQRRGCWHWFMTIGLTLTFFGWTMAH